MFPKRNGVTNSSTGGGSWMGARSGGASQAATSNPMTGGGSYGSAQMMANEINMLKQENMNLQSMLYDVQNSRDKLKLTVQKLRVENGRLKLKIKRVGELAKSSDGKPLNVDALTSDVDFDSIGEFLLIGGTKDPLDVQHAVPVKDRDGRQFKTGERYLWFKMAEHFNDAEAAQQFLTLDDDKKAQELVEKVKNFDQTAWDAVKMRYFEEYQRLKFEQNRPLRCLLLKTAPQYLAVASQDKTYGTGWRKQRLEADRPKMWDGENLGGKFLMKLRDEYSTNHTWVSAAEEEEAKKQFEENKRSIWRKPGGRSGAGGMTRGVKREGGGADRRRGGDGGARRGVGARRGGTTMMGMGGPASLFGSVMSDPFGTSAGSYYGGDGYTSFSSAPLSSTFGAIRNGGPPFKRRR